jgi:hypothetical protein
MKQVRVVETVRETSLGPRSSFVVEERRWWGWTDVSSIDGYQLGTREQVADFLRTRDTADRVVIHDLRSFPQTHPLRGGLMSIQCGRNRPK